MLLTKARLTLLVLLTTWAGFYLAMDPFTPSGLLFHTLLGTALVAASASALNQLMERQIDAKMIRTQDRPLPSGRMHPDEVLLIAFGTGAGGLLYLAWSTNLLTSLLSATTLLSYVLLYTPLKKISTLNTLVGAIPGALPPVIGWAAVTNSIPVQAWVLFGILFFWQMPHFLAIAWFCREDYERAGLKMLPVLDPTGASTGRQAVIYCASLLPISLLPLFVRMAGPLYFVAALGLGIAFISLAVRFSKNPELPTARKLFFGSIIYLPLLLLALCLDKRPIF